MKRITVVWLSLVAVLAFSAVAAAAASARNEVLFNSASFTFQSKNLPAPKNIAILTIPSEEGSTIECETTSGGGEATDKHLGTITTEFGKCSATLFGIKGECKSGATAGVIILKGTFHLGLGTDGTPKKAAILVLVPEFGFTCTILGISKEIKVKGSVMGLLKEATVAKEPVKVLPTEYEEVELVFGTTGSGSTLKQEDTQFELSLVVEGTAPDTAALEANAGNGFKPAVQKSETVLNKFNTANKKIGLELEVK